MGVLKLDAPDAVEYLTLYINIQGIEAMAQLRE